MGRVLVWFRDDLRIDDNPAIQAAAASSRPIECIYIHDTETIGHRPPGAAVLWWLDKSLRSLATSLEALGSSLTILVGPAASVLPEAVQRSGATAVYWNRRYAKAERETDAELKRSLRAAGCTVETFNAALLHEPWEITSKTGGPMKVFSPFWRTCLARGEPPIPLPAPMRLAGVAPADRLSGVAIDDLGLHPRNPDWSGGMQATWTPGEQGARERLRRFLDRSANGYAANRDRPDMPSTSMLSPFLRFGEISPRRIWHTTQHAVADGKLGTRDAEKFLAEIGWREFSYHLLFHAEDLTRINVQGRFNAFPWRQDDTLLRRWQRGQTGYPVVDAGMRQLWQTGWMHNRVRMVVASFLVKHLLIDWRAGENWFWDTLVDADPANNPASWQWVAGSGADAAPYFRIFNPISQGTKFDPDGDYVRHYVPELARLPTEDLHAPWLASRETLSRAGVTLGVAYPFPVVDHAAARDRAMAAFQSLQDAA